MKETSKERTTCSLAELIKWKLSLAVAFSSATGFFLAGTGPSHGLAALSAGVFLLASGAAALNQYTERESDALMERTMNRPLPSGKMRPPAAIAIAVSLLLTGSLVLLTTGVLPVMLGIFNVVLYNLVYTGLKKKTVLAIIPGALVGAIPPFIGYSAAEGNIAGREIILFSLYMFLWQMPHFWILLVRYGDEYRKAGIRTLYDSYDARRIGQIVFAWVASSSLIMLILMTLLIPMRFAIGALLFLPTATFNILLCRVIFCSGNRWNLKLAFILINSFTFAVMTAIIIISCSTGS